MDLAVYKAPVMPMLCYGCDLKEKYAETSELDPDPEQPEDKIEIDTDSEKAKSLLLEIEYVSYGYHECQKTGDPKVKEQLVVRPEKKKYL